MANLHIFIQGQTLTANDLNSNFAIVANGGGGGSVNTSQQYTFTNVITFASNLIVNSYFLDSSNSAGTNGQVLSTNGSAVIWQSLGAVGVNTSAQYIWSNTQTFTNTITFNSTINGTANNSLYIGGLPAANVVSNAQLIANLANYVTATNLTNNLANYQTTAGLSANVATLTSNNTSFVGSVSAANVVSNAQLVANLANYQTTAGLSANVATLTANNTNFVGSVSAANVVSNSQLSSNLTNYQTTAGLSANVATLTSNNTNFVGSVSAANVVSNAQLSSNLSNYQTTAGLSANVATLTSNNTNFVGSVSAANVVSNAQLSSNLSNYVTATNLNNNLANYQTTAGLSANVATLTANNTLFVGSVSAANVVSNGQLSSNLTNYAALTGATFTGNVTANNIQTTYDLNVGRNVTISGNLNVYGTTVTVNAANFTTVDNMLYLNEPATATVTNASGNGSVITYTALNAFSNLGVVSITGIVPSGFNNANYVPVLFANSSTFQVSNTFTGTFTSNGTASYKSGINPDLGIVGGYNDGSYHHSGIMRDYADGYWKVFDNYTPEPDQAINIVTTDPSFHIANFWANTINIGNTSVYAIINTTNYSQTSNNTLYVGSVTAANVVSNAQLSSNLSNYALLSGATFTSNIAVTFGSNTLSINSSSITLKQIIANGAFGANGTVLASNGTGVYWASDSAVGNIVANSITTNSLSANHVSVNNDISVGNSSVNSAMYSDHIFTGNATLNISISPNLLGGGGGSTQYGPAITIGGPLNNGPGGYPVYAPQGAAFATTANLLYVNTSLIQLGNSIAYANISSSNIFIGNTSVSVVINSTAFSGTANNTSFVGTVSAANVVSNAQLSSNLSNYATTGSVTSNATTAYSNAVNAYTSNNTTYTGNNTFGGTNTIFNSNVTYTAALYTANLIFTSPINLDGGTF